MSLLFYRDGKGYLNVENCLVCGNSVITERDGYSNVIVIYDIDMSEAVQYIKETIRDKAVHINNSIDFSFVNSIWLKRAIHVGILYGALYHTGGYHFSLYEIDRLIENLLAYNIDPLDKEKVKLLIQNHSAPAFNDRFSKRFFHIMMEIGGFEKKIS